MSKKYTTNFLEDTNGSTGSANQVLVSTAAGIDWVDGSGSGIIGGPYLPLSAGSSYPLTGTLYGTSTNFSGSGDYAGSMTLGAGASTAEAHLTIGQGRTDSGFSYIDLVGGTTYPDYGLRIIRGNTGANAGGGIYHRGTGNLDIQATDSASILLKTNNTTALTLTNTQNAIFTGDVGIGTTSPAGPLNISKNNPDRTTALDLLYLTSTNSLTGYNGNGTAIVDFRRTYQESSKHVVNRIKFIERGASATDYGGAIQFETKALSSGTAAPVTRMSIDYNGNVGIGTTSPYKKLEVVGDLQLDASNASMWIKSGAAGTSGFINWTFSADNTVYNKIGIDYDTRASTGFHIDTGYPLTLDCTNYIDFKRSGGTLGRWTSTGLGIGTTSPFSKLEVVDTNRAPSLTFNAAAAFSISTNATDQLVFGQNTVGPYNYWLQARTASGAALKMSINPLGGNVGIGTSSPSEKLDVNGVINIQNGFSGPSSETGYRLKFYDNGGTNNDTGIGLDGSAAGNEKMWFNSLGGFYWNDGTNGQVMTIDGNGNVGIGTASPGVKLTTVSTAYNQSPTLGSGTIGSQALLDVAGNYGQYSGVSNNGDVWHQVQRNDANAAVYNMLLNPLGGNVTMGANVIVANGLLGIGTTTLSNRLSVGGNGNGWDTSPAIKMWDSFNSKGWYVGSANNNTPGDFYIRSVTAENLYPVAANQQFTIKQSGNVGIGTITPDFKLDVAGDVRIEGDSGLYFGDTGTSPKWGMASTGLDLLINNSTTNGDVVFLNDGGVGIGVSSPGEKLEVGGTIKSIGTAPKLLISNTKNGTWTAGESLGLLEWYGADASGGGAKIQSSIDVVAQDQYGAHFNMLFKLSKGSTGNLEVMKLTGEGDLTMTSGTVSATNFILNSDRRLKTKIKEIETSHIDVNWKNFELKSEPGIKRAGVIAQELEEKHPEFVRTDDEGMKSVAYIDLLIAKIAELEARLEKAGI